MMTLELNWRKSKLLLCVHTGDAATGQLRYYLMSDRLAYSEYGMGTPHPLPKNWTAS